MLSLYLLMKRSTWSGERERRDGTVSGVRSSTSCRVWNCSSPTRVSLVSESLRVLLVLAFAVV